MAVTPRGLGAGVALATLAADQANKLWLIFVYGIEARQPVRLTPFLDVIYAKNTGISYSLLRANSAFGRYVLLAFALAATLFLGAWLWRAQTRTVAIALGLIIGGALGNAYDRFAYGFVADFYHFHVGTFSWYVFNFADVAIVGGVALLLYDSLFSSSGDREGAAGQ
jgi:signal peptidase II